MYRNEQLLELIKGTVSLTWEPGTALLHLLTLVLTLKRLRCAMSSRMTLFFAVLLLFASVLCHPQTATCTNWTFFNSFVPSGINRWGTVVGSSAQQRDGSIAGYVRYSNGTTKKYMDPNAAPPLNWTFLTKPNEYGVTVGYYRDPSQNNHGLLLSGSSFATLDYPGSVETILMGINKWNTVVGFWGLGDFSQPFDGFKMWANGAVAAIDAPGAMQTNPAAISDTGVVVGWFVPRSAQPPFPDHGFVLADGVYTTVDHPNANRTFLTDINSSGVIVGSWYQGGSLGGGFLYLNGKFKNVFGPQGETTGVDGINNGGYVTGTISGGSSFIANCQ